MVLISFSSLGGEIEEVKVEERNDYSRVTFSLKNMPKYSISQEGETIILRFKGINSSGLENFLETLSFLEPLRKAKIQAILNTRGNDLEFTLLPEDNGELRGHSYAKPSGDSKFFRIIIDIGRIKQEFADINNFIVDRVSPLEKNEAESKSISEIIMDNVKANSIDDLFALNNILDDVKITENLEQQNNNGVDLYDFLKEIAKKERDEIKIHDSKKNVNRILPAQHDRRFVLVIDAGHGGRDSGAIGRMGTKEKDINLKFAKGLENELKKIKKIKVHLTRSSDRYLSLSDRIRKSRDLGANLLISVHSDSNINKNIRGLTIYTLARTASDIRTVNYLRKHNMTMTRSIESYRGKFDIFNTMLDISRHSSMNESNKFAEILSRNFINSRNIDTVLNPHKYGNFAILLAPEFPSVLIELGFLSNIKDENLLKIESYRTDIAKQIARSIVDYISNSQGEYL
jgi:N-acetylmuramoyl-L-alanine amidase